MALRVLSLGFGIQSTALAVMAALGDIPPVDAAIFSDTGWERELTYQVVDFYVPWLRARGVPVFVLVPHLDIFSSHFLLRRVSMPLYTSPVVGRPFGQLRRECTGDFKIEPVRRQIRSLLGVNSCGRLPSGLVDLLLGISVDEVERAAPSRVAFISHRFPLLDFRLSRQGCVAYLEERGLLVPPRSSCIGCPFHSHRDWQGLSSSERVQAIRFDRAIRGLRGGSKGWSLYVHSSCSPLDRALEFADMQLELFPSVECSGGCWL